MRIFEPLTIRGMTLKNRIIMPPMHVGMGYRGSRARNYYAERARGGVAAVTVQATFVDVLCSDESWGRQGAVAEFVQGLRPLIDAVHEPGAKIGIQLAHLNRLPLGLSLEDRRGEPIAPSPRQETDPPVVFLAPGQPMRELTVPEIEFIISKFAASARNAKAAGFDFVEFHSAHGYLPCQFLSPIYNRRNDKYGGNLAGRLRFGIESIRAMREAVGDDYPIFVRLGVEEHRPGGLTLAEGAEVAHALEQAGADVISVSLADHVPLPLPTVDYPMGCFAYLAAAVKQRVRVPVIAVGRINRPEVAEDILAREQADLIAIGRQLIADPFWVKKVQEGNTDDITPCLSCNSCLQVVYGAELRCAVNAAAGREEQYRITPAEQPKKVMVIGGGPAGMEAARVAAQRGHKVTLYEKNDLLGGQLRVASVAPHKEAIADLRNYLIRQVYKAGVEVSLNNEVSAPTVQQVRPDAVILATGAIAFRPDIPGAERDNVVTAEDVLSGRRQVGTRVVIIGGELVACDTAEYLAERGRKVTMLRRGPQVLTGAILPQFRQPVLDRLAAKGVAMLTSVRYEEITDRGLIFRDSQGKRVTIEADTVVLAAGARPNAQLANELKGKLALLYAIGDCMEPRRIREAIHDGAHVAREI